MTDVTPPAVQTFDPKTPAEEKPYAIDFSLALGADTIATATWTRDFAGDDDVTLTDATEAGGRQAIVIAAAGVAGGWYSGECRVVTAGGSTHSKHFCLPVVARK